MRIVVWGAGAIGGVVGAWMARQGEQITLIDRDEEHVAAIRQRGLLIDGVRGEFRVQVPASLPEEAEGPIDIAFLAVKCQHTGGALDLLAPLLAPEGTIVSLQNGLNELEIADRVGAQRTIGCFVNFGADWQGPGHIQHGGEHPLFVGELDGSRSERVGAVGRLLSLFCETQVTANIWGYLWAKLCYASLLYGTALVDEPVYEVVRRPEAAQVLYELVKEMMQLGQAQGIHLEQLLDYHPEEYAGGDWGPAMERTASHFQGQIKIKTGIWRDLAVRRRKTEVDCQIGAAVRKGAELGIPMPLNRRLIALVHELEDGKRIMSWENFAQLEGA